MLNPSSADLPAISLPICYQPCCETKLHFFRNRAIKLKHVARNERNAPMIVVF
jgi:hypothetical protein